MSYRNHFVQTGFHGHAKAGSGRFWKQFSNDQRVLASIAVSLLLVVLVVLPMGALAQSTTALPGMPSAFPAETLSLDAQVLKTRLEGHAFKAKLQDGSGWRLQFKGEYVYFNHSSGTNDSGTWRADSGRLCVDYKVLPSGCSEMRGFGEDLYLKRSSTGEIVKLEAND